MASVRCFIQNCNFPWHKVMHFRTWGTATYRGMWRSSQHLWLRKWKPESFCLREHLSPNPSLCLRTAPSVLSQGHTPVQGRKRHICTEGKLIVSYLNMRNSPSFWPETEQKRQGTDHLFLWASMIKNTLWRQETPTWENWKRCPVCGKPLSVLSLAERDELGGLSRTVSGSSMLTQSC